MEPAPIRLLPVLRCLFPYASTLFLATITAVSAADLPLFDVHIHDNHDAWESVSAKEAIARPKEAGVLRALLSSSGDEGTQRLSGEARDLIIPELRPYRKNGETSTWFLDESTILCHTDSNGWYFPAHSLE